MSVNVYERIWMWGAGGLIVLFLAAIGITAVTQAVQPPSHIETINPATLAEHPEFTEAQVHQTLPFNDHLEAFFGSVIERRP